MERKIRVSVIMGVYEQKNFQYLEQAVQSILEQSFEDFEFLIYNDGSGPETTEKLRELQAEDARIRCIESTENRGLAYGLNQCIAEAKGEYLARMDDDDISLPERLKRQVEFLDTHPRFDYVGSSAQLIDEEKIWGIRRMKEHPEAEDYFKYSPFIHPSVMFRRSVFERFGGYDISGRRRRCEDYELFLRLYAAGCRGYNIQNPLFVYRENIKGYGKRKYSYRVDECRLRLERFGTLGQKRMGIKPVFYALRPLAGSAVPDVLRMYIKKQESRRKAG